MAESLKQKTIKGLIWSAIEKMSSQVITFILSLIIARLVTPADYGTLAIVMVFITIAGVFVDSGFANALVQKIDSNDIDRSTVFYFNIGISTILYIALYLSAPYIADFYNNSELIPLIKYAGIIIIINSFSIIQQAVLTTSIDFKKQTYVSLFSSIVSGIVGVVMAYLGYGVIALVSQVVIAASIRTFMLFLLVRWKPLFIFSISSFRNLFGYSFKLLLSGLVGIGSSESKQLVIARFFSASGLGIYNYAYKMAAFPSHSFATIIQRVLFPAFCKVQDNNELLSEKYRESQILSMVIIVPIMFSLSVLSRPIVSVLLTPSWDETIPLLQIIAAYKAIFPLIAFNRNILWVKKQAGLTLMFEIIYLIMNIAIICTMPIYGLKAICISLGVVEILNFIVYATMVGRVCTYGLIRQIKDILPTFFAATISYIVVYYFLLPYISNNISQIIIGTIAMAISYILLVVLTQKHIINLIKNILLSSETSA